MVGRRASSAGRAAAPGRRTTGRSRRRVAALVGAVVVALGLLAVLRLARVAGQLEQAQGHLEAASAQLVDGDLAGARRSLQAGEELLVTANGALATSPDLALARLLPVASHNLDALRESTGVALRLAAGGDRLLDIASPLQSPTGSLELSLRDGGVPAEVLVEARRELAALASSLPATSSEPSFLVGPVREARRRLLDEVDERRAQLDALSRGLTIANELTGAEGPRRHLIAVANTAEMRGAGGMVLSYGVLEADGGQVELAAFGPIDELFLDSPLGPAVGLLDEGEEERWGDLEPTRLWRNANLVPDLSVVGPRLAAMYRAATGEPVDGVVVVDPAGLAAVLRATGPVDVAGLGPVGSDEAVRVVLHDAYLATDDQDQRRELLGDLAEATFDRLLDGELESVRVLGRSLVEAAEARHVALWSSRPTVGAAAASFGADAALPAPDELDHLLLTVQNLGRNKLDYHLDTALAVEGERPAGRPGELVATVRIANELPPDVDAPYVVGDPAATGADVPPGTYRGAVSLYVPVGTSVVGGGGGGSTPVLRAEQGRAVVAWDVVIGPGEEIVTTVRLSLPPRPAGPYELVLVPQPRVRPTEVVLDVGTGGGRVVYEGPLVDAVAARRPASGGDPAPDGEG